MRTLLCLLLFFCFHYPARAQQPYFIYLQSEGGQPFFVKLEDRILSSLAPGYLILPDMADSTYQLAIGFSSGRRMARFSIPVGSRDRGFLLSREGDAPRLADLQSSRPVAALPDPFSNISYTMRSDPFTLLLSRAAHDSDILYVPVELPAVAEVRKREPEVQQPVSAPSTPFVGDTSATVARTPPLQDTRASQASTDSAALARITRPRDTIVQPASTLTVTDSGAIATRTDSTTVSPVGGSRDSLAAVLALNVRDTITVLPKPETERAPAVTPPVTITDTVSAGSTATDSAAAAVEPVFQRSVVRKYGESSTSEGFGLVYIDKTETGADTIRLLIPNPLFNLKRSEPDTVKNDDPELFLRKKNDTTVALPAPMKPSANCPVQASGTDFLKLRRLMVSRSSEESMAEEARKYFKKMCFTTAQIRSLGALFLTDAGKYLFFDTAYLHVSDQQQFPTLATEIQDPYYSKRFKALIGE